MICQNCKLNLSDTAKFCTRCGRSICSGAGATNNQYEANGNGAANAPINFGYYQMRRFRWLSVFCVAISWVVPILFMILMGEELFDDVFGMNVALFSGSGVLNIVIGIIQLVGLGASIGGIVYAVRTLCAGDNPYSTGFVKSGQTCFSLEFWCALITQVWILIKAETLVVPDIVDLILVGLNAFVFIPKYHAGIIANKEWCAKYENLSAVSPGTSLKSFVQPQQALFSMEKKNDTIQITDGWTCKNCGRKNQKLDQTCRDCGEYR